MRLFVCLVLVLAAGLASCRKSDLYENFVAEDLREKRRSVLEAMESRDQEALISHFGDWADTEEFRGRLGAFLEEMPAGNWVDPPELAGAHRSHSQMNGEEGVHNQSLVYITRTETDHVKIDLFFTRADDQPWSLHHINAYTYQPNPGISFTDGTMTPVRLASLAAVLANFIFIVVTLIATFRFRRIKRRILWPLFIIAGFPVFGFDWTSETWHLIAPGISSSGTSVYFRLFEVAFFGAGFVDPSPVEPVMLQLGVPIGAILFWYRVMRGGPTRRAEKVPR
ncbi:MAG: hypothetical protein VX529_11690 [Pseudomonadota bacterium]|nr:hypothetical protein [Pseudomonadota bacterium]